MVKDYGLKYIEIVEGLFDRLDQGRSVETSKLVEFTIEFWSSVCPSILGYAAATPEVRLKTRKILERQKEIVKGLKA